MRQKAAISLTTDPNDDYSDYSDYLVLSTRMSSQEHKYAEIYGRGIGAHNYDSSIIRVDDNIILDHH